MLLIKLFQFRFHGRFFLEKLNDNEWLLIFAFFQFLVLFFALVSISDADGKQIESSSESSLNYHKLEGSSLISSHFPPLNFIHVAVELISTIFYLAGSSKVVTRWVRLAVVVA